LFFFNYPTLKARYDLVVFKASLNSNQPTNHSQYFGYDITDPVLIIAAFFSSPFGHQECIYVYWNWHDWHFEVSRDNAEKHSR